MIKNKEELLKNAQSPLDRKARALVLQAYSAALSASCPKRIMKSQLLSADSCLKIQDQTFCLDNFAKIYVVGAGKASGSMAEALEEILGDRIEQGLVNVPHGLVHKTDRIEINHAGHPAPDESGVYGTRKMVAIAEKAEENDLLICLISGGGSSLMPLPAEGISLTDKRRITGMLLRSGASIAEINTVRKHISAVKGGWLAKRAFPATVINLILSDVPGDPLDCIASGPTVADSTTFADALRILEKFDLLASTPDSISNYLRSGINGSVNETPKPEDQSFCKVFNFVIGNNQTATEAALRALQNAGLKVRLLSPVFTGKAAQVAKMLAEMALEKTEKDNEAAPFAIIGGGETTVSVTGNGLGGRNQEMALAAVETLGGIDGLVFAALSTDGIDGPTDAAGAIVDGRTRLRATELGLCSADFLRRHDSYHLFKQLGDLVITGYTGTNVNDLYLIVRL